MVHQAIRPSRCFITSTCLIHVTALKDKAGGLATYLSMCNVGARRPIKVVLYVTLQCVDLFSAWISVLHK